MGYVFDELPRLTNPSQMVSMRKLAYRGFEGDHCMRDRSCLRHEADQCAIYAVAIRLQRPLFRHIQFLGRNQPSPTARIWLPPSTENDAPQLPLCVFAVSNVPLD